MLTGPRVTRWLPALALAAMLGACSGDGVPGREGRCYAVVAGVSEYRVGRFNLRYADDDAVSFRQALLAGGNWRPGDITFLLNSGATKSAIRRAIQDTAAGMEPGDKLVFYFSGHGTWGPDLAPPDEPDGWDEYLVPHDALEASFANDIRDDELESWLAAVPGGNVAVILDSSFSGGLFKALDHGVKSIVRPWHEGRAPMGAADGMARDVGRPGFVILTASDDHESPIETPALGHGVFTYYLVQGMEGPADFDADATVSAEESYEYAAGPSTEFYGGMHPQMLDLHPGQYGLVDLR